MEDLASCVFCRKTFKYLPFAVKHACKFETLIQGDDFIICELCNKPFKELNSEHLVLKHGVFRADYERLYGTTLSTTSRYRKNVYRDISPETRHRLSRSHSKIGYIEKYGEIEGREKYEARCRNINFARTLSYYVEKYGEIEGKRKFSEVNKKKGITLTGYITKYGAGLGQKKYDQHIKRRKYLASIDYFITKYGQAEGEDKYIRKMRKLWESSNSVPKERADEFGAYLRLVYRFTRQIVNAFHTRIPDIAKRSRQWHLDHKVSVFDGFNNSIDPRYISAYVNLEILLAKENCSKQGKSSIPICDLISSVDNELCNDVELLNWWNAKDQHAQC